MQGLNQSTPLHFAASRGHLQIVEILLEYGADFTATNVYPNNDLKNTPVDLAAINGHFEVVDCLLQYEYYFKSTRANPPLHSISIAAGLGKLEILEIMIKNGYDVNDESSNKVTPLHMAARMENFKIAKFLVQNKANVNAKTGNGSYTDYGNSTPLHDVAKNGDFEIAELLLQSGAQVDAVGYYNQTPLHFAADEGQCGNFMIFPSLRFYVKSILWILEVQKLPFLPF